MLTVIGWLLWVFGLLMAAYALWRASQDAAAAEQTAKRTARLAAKVEDQLELGLRYRVWQRAMLVAGGASASQSRASLQTLEQRVELLARARLEEQISKVCCGTSSEMYAHVVGQLSGVFGRDAVFEALAVHDRLVDGDESEQGRIASEPTGSHHAH